jgi:pheromone shutdown protein TraB
MTQSSNASDEAKRLVDELEGEAVAFEIADHRGISIQAQQHLEAARTALLTYIADLEARAAQGGKLS